MASKGQEYPYKPFPFLAMPYNADALKSNGKDEYLYMAMTMTAVRMTARQTRIAIRKFRFMFSAVTWAFVRVFVYLSG
jgi:hypothetical protein